MQLFLSAWYRSAAEFVVKDFLKFLFVFAFIVLLCLVWLFVCFFILFFNFFLLHFDAYCRKDEDDFVLFNVTLSLGARMPCSGFSEQTDSRPWINPPWM